ncbi:hypothetical protein PG995_015978 [Apiospora arundinis]
MCKNAPTNPQVVIGHRRNLSCHVAIQLLLNNIVVGQLVLLEHLVLLRQLMLDFLHGLCELHLLIGLSELFVQLARRMVNSDTQKTGLKDLLALSQHSRSLVNVVKGLASLINANSGLATHLLHILLGDGIVGVCVLEDLLTAQLGLLPDLGYLILSVGDDALLDLICFLASLGYGLFSSSAGLVDDLRSLQVGVFSDLPDLLHGLVDRLDSCLLGSGSQGIAEGLVRSIENSLLIARCMLGLFDGQLAVAVILGTLAGAADRLLDGVGFTAARGFGRGILGLRLLRNGRRVADLESGCTLRGGRDGLYHPSGNGRSDLRSDLRSRGASLGLGRGNVDLIRMVTTCHAVDRPSSRYLQPVTDILLDSLAAELFAGLGGVGVGGLPHGGLKVDLTLNSLSALALLFRLSLLGLQLGRSGELLALGDRDRGRIIIRIDRSLGCAGADLCSVGGRFSGANDGINGMTNVRMSGINGMTNVRMSGINGGMDSGVNGEMNNRIKGKIVVVR